MQVKQVKRIFFIATAVYAGLCALLYFGQRRLIYLPSYQSIPLPPGFTPWMSGNVFIGYKSEKGSERALLFFQGNGGNASGWSQALADFPGDVYCMEYPGYGARKGSPSETALGQAAVDAFDALPRGKDVIVCGQSLGTGVAAHLLQQRTVSKLVLITPFTSLVDIAAAQYPYIPVRLMLKDRYPVLEPWLNHKKSSCVLLAENDEIIPKNQSENFLNNAGKNRHITVIPHASHNDVRLDADEWSKVLTLLEQE